MQLLSLTEVRRHAQNGAAVEARVHVQIEGVAAKVTREQKPYCELSLADACDRMTLRVWSDHPEYKPCSTLKASDFIELSGEFVQHQQFGLDARNWKVRHLNGQERSELLQGPAELRAKQAADWEYINERARAIEDPRLRALGEAFLAEHGERFKRTAGARSYHHARRGGLVEHVAQMMRMAIAIAPLYPHLNLDLLVAGVLFHDARMEMFAAGYLVAKPIADRIFDRVRPLPGNLVKPLEKYQAPNSNGPPLLPKTHETGTLL